MDRVLEELRRVRRSADAEAVHDLRVAIRRCRSVAAVMTEVDGHRTWRAIRTLPRELFRTLGTLRDLQVLQAWVKQLALPEDPLRVRLLKLLHDRQAGPHDSVRRAIRRFEQHAWERLARTAPRRASLVNPHSLTAQCLALERYEELRVLHARAVRTDAPAPWHALRVGLKRFRYSVETLLPERSAAWDEGLGQLQGLLGEIHDLDVLRSRITAESSRIDATSGGSLRQAIAEKRRACIEQYRHAMLGESSPLREWRTGLPHRKAIEAATAARLRTTERAMDPHPRRTATISRLSLQMFDGLATCGASSRFRDTTLRTILQTAAQLHAIRVRRRRSGRHKAAYDFLRAVPAPLGWTSHEWELVATVVRYHRGPEPARRHKAFAHLSPDQQDRVRSLAGVLRLARVLHKCGASASAGVHVNASAAYVRIRISGVQDTEGNAARLAAAKHLLERYLRRPLLIEPAKPIHALRLAHRSPRPSANRAAAAPHVVSHLVVPGFPSDVRRRKQA